MPTDAPPPIARPPDSSISSGRDGRDYLLRAEQWLPANPAAVWRFVADCRHMSHVIPSFMRFRILSPMPGGEPTSIAPGVTYDYELRLHGIGFFWRTLMLDVDHPHRFKDEQAKGPYQHFSHEHKFDPVTVDGVAGTLTRDTIRYRPPGGPLAGLVDAALVRRDLRRLFEHRHRRLAELFAEGQDSDPAALFSSASSVPA